MKLSSTFRVEPGSNVNLNKWKTDDDAGWSKDDAAGKLAELQTRLTELQELLYAEGRHAVLIILQAMDAGGKDSTIKAVLAPINPQGCRVVNYKGPNDVEIRHDFLWRIHQNTPRLGYIHLFNRSHYEDVLIVRVKNLAPKERWQARYEHINAFERMLVDEGTIVLKFFLHISKEYQKDRLERRLARPDKWWKFDPSDLVERDRWEDYQKAYEAVLERCSTEHAPWHVVPAEKRWFRNLAITSVLVDTLEALDMHFPEPRFDPSKLSVK